MLYEDNVSEVFAQDGDEMTEDEDKEPEAAGMDEKEEDEETE